MDPADFLSLALRLSNSQREADLRTAVSRAYYGAFHLARQLLEDCNVPFSGKELYKAEVHQKVRYCFGESGVEDAVLVGKKLGYLRERRNRADYDLKLALFQQRNNSAFDVRVAQETVDALGRCRSEPTFTTLRDNVRAYARDVLRLPVDGD